MFLRDLPYKEIEQPNYVPTYYDEHISALYFYRNLALIHKGSP